MLTADTKRHIDAARQVLVGVVPNPMSQIDQITNALIYKFMDDMDQQAIKAGGEPSFFTGTLEKYAWTKLMDARLGNQERMNLYTEALTKFSESKQLPELFRNIFRQAFLPYRDPETLGLFLKEISYFDYTHSEELGNAYEYLLSIMSSQGDAGQFRTPRHIIDFIVEVVAPTKNDAILDPACGTAGFLISAYNYIKNQNSGTDQKTGKQKQLTPDERKKLINNFEGYDIDPTMVRMSQVNMYLHRFTTPKIYNYNTLASEERWGDKFDVILANPPFMSPKGGIKPHNKFSINSNRAEVLFVDYIMNHLKPKGRAGVIVPDGIISTKTNAYKQLRKKLVEDGLSAVVSLPNGVFKPYTDVKTSILLFDNELSKKSDEVLFFTINQDGFEFGAQRKKTDQNDIPEALNVLNTWKTGKKIKSENAEWIKRSKILENDDCILIGGYYQENVISQNSKSFSLVELKELVKEKSDRVRSKDIEVWSVSNEKGFVKSEEYFSKKVASENISNYKIVDIHNFAYNPSRINVGSIALNIKKTQGAVSPMYVVFEVDESKVLPEFLFILLKSDRLREEIDRRAYGAVRKQLRFSDLQKLTIPLPPLNIQKEIIEEIQAKKDAIESAKQTITKIERERELFGRSLRRIDGIEWLELKEVCKYEGGTQPPKSTFIHEPKEGYIRLLQIRDYKSDANPVYIPIKARHKTCTNEDIMIGRYGPPVFQILRGKSGAYNVALMKCVPDTNRITNGWLYYFLLSAPIQDRIISVSTRARQAGVHSNDLDKLMIPVPSLEIQKQLVSEMEEQETIIGANKKLIGIMEKKIDEVLAVL